MKQEKRIIIANDTLEIFKNGFYLNKSGRKVDVSKSLQQAVSHTRLFRPKEMDDLLTGSHGKSEFDTRYEVTNETTCDAVRRLAGGGLENILCLNFASAKNPGGGFLRGSLAQEECIARASGLYPCLMAVPDYYRWHRSNPGGLYSDHMIYSPGVPLIKDEEGNVLDEIVCTAIITSPATNAGAIRNNEPAKIDDIVPVMRTRIDKMLALCKFYQHETLVLGAWGCGVFQNDPDTIAQLFHESLTNRFSGQFKRILFAVKTNDEQIIGPFRKRFGSS